MVTTVFCEINGLNIHYEEQGTGESVLFLHGWGSSMVPFVRLIDALKDTHRVVAVEFPGCGQSETMKTPWTNTDYCNFVIQFMEKVGLTDPVLIGHSHGGRVILELVGTARVHPPKIILLDSAGLIPEKTARQKRRAASFKLIKKTLTMPGIRRVSGGLLEKARKHYGSADYLAAPPVLRQTLVNLVNTDLSDLLPNITCPCLLIWGENDTDTPVAVAKRMEAAIPDAGLCLIKGGHFSFLDDTYAACAILRNFLS